MCIFIFLAMVFSTFAVLIAFRYDAELNFRHKPIMVNDRGPWRLVPLQ